MTPIVSRPMPSGLSRSRMPLKSLRNQRGQAAVEIALLLPVLLVLLFGIILSGFTFYAFIQVSNAAREGARAGSVWRLTQAASSLCLEPTVERAIYDSGSGTSALGWLSPTSPSFNVTNDVTITLIKPDNSLGVVCDPRPGDRLTVWVTYRYRLPLVSVLLPQFPQPIVIVRDVMMEVQ